MFKYTHMCTQTWYNYALPTHTPTHTYTPTHPAEWGFARLHRQDTVHMLQTYTHTCPEVVAIDTSNGVQVLSFPLLVGTTRNCRSLGELPKAVVVGKMGMALTHQKEQTPGQGIWFQV